MQNHSDDYEDESVLSLIQNLRYHAESLLVYTPVLETPVGSTFLNLLHQLQQQNSDPLNYVRAYSEWFRVLAYSGQTWKSNLLTQLITTENPLTLHIKDYGMKKLPQALLDATSHDLKSLHVLAQCTPQHISQWVQSIADIPEAPIAWIVEPEASLSDDNNRVRSLPIWATLNDSRNWADCINELIQHYYHYGTGVTAQYSVLRWQSGQFIGIATPDPIRIDELAAYDIPRKTLIQNTEALIAGYRALHILLYGSRGSGKSSLVKALVNEYCDRGLRLIEVVKQELQHLPTIVDMLRDQPHKFIIFVDDLSFEEDDDAFKALKVVLEGSVTARPQNVVVYATSNRRHLIREFHGDRPRPKDADEIHAWDTVQEKLSFSDRFGLTLTFEPADQSTYIAIVHHLAKLHDIQLPEEDLDYRALQWATRHNGRSGRTARQFIDALEAELKLVTT